MKHLAQLLFAIAITLLLPFNTYATKRPMINLCIYDGGEFENGALAIKINGASVQMVPSELPLYKQEYCALLEIPISVIFLFNGEEQFGAEYIDADHESESRILVITKQGKMLYLKDIPTSQKYSPPLFF